MSFDSVQIKNSAGPLEIRSDSAITLKGNSLEGDSVFVNSGGQLILSGSDSGIRANNNISLDSADGMQVGGVSLSVSSEIGELNLVNTKGMLTVNNGASLSASFIGINSRDGVLIDSANFSGTQLDVTAGSLAGQVATVRNLNLAAFSLVNIAARTVDLINVAFPAGSSVNLKSFNHQLAPNPNTGAASQPGFVNFISGVTYGGQPAQDFVGNGITISGLNGSSLRSLHKKQNLVGNGVNSARR